MSTLFYYTYLPGSTHNPLPYTTNALVAWCRWGWAARWDVLIQILLWDTPLHLQGAGQGWGWGGVLSIQPKGGFEGQVRWHRTGFCAVLPPSCWHIIWPVLLSWLQRLQRQTTAGRVKRWLPVLCRKPIISSCFPATCQGWFIGAELGEALLEPGQLTNLCCFVPKAGLFCCYRSEDGVRMVPECVGIHQPALTGWSMEMLLVKAVESSLQKEQRRPLFVFFFKLQSCQLTFGDAPVFVHRPNIMLIFKLAVLVTGGGNWCHLGCVALFQGIWANRAPNPLKLPHSPKTLRLFPQPHLGAHHPASWVSWAESLLSLQ